MTMVWLLRYVVAIEPEAKELNDDITDNDGGGGMIIVQASEPSGEGAVSCHSWRDGHVDDDADEDAGGGSHFGEISKFWTGFAAGNYFLDPYRVELIDKRLIFDLDYSTNR